MQNRIKRIKKRANRYLKDDFNYRSNNSNLHTRTVFLESFDGTSQTCHPLAIFEYLIEHPDYKKFRFIWSHKNAKPQGYTWEKYSKYRNVTWVKHGSFKYYRALARAKYLISNSTFPHQFTKNPNQVYLNTWHGIPLKNMGYDIPLGIPSTRNVIRNLMSADFALSHNQFMTEKIWGSAFKLDGIFQGKVLESGSPRLDAQFNRASGDTKNLELLGLEPDDTRKIVLYAPTWRGKSPSNIYESGPLLAEEYTLLSNSLDPDKYLVLLKIHQLALRSIDEASVSKMNIIDNSVPTNLILPEISHLVTDESSIMFDYLVHDKPIHFYFSEFALNDERGLYVEKNALPGTVNFDIPSVINSIIASETKDIHKKDRANWRSIYQPNEDGTSTERIVEAVFKNDLSKIQKVNSFLNTDRKKILIHVGSLIANGITTAAINIANHLVAEGHDVSIFYPYSKNENQVAKVYGFAPEIRHFPRVGTIALPLSSRREYRRYLSNGGRRAKNVKITNMQSIFAREWTRCFGHADFDTIIAFDGYSVFWAELLLASTAKNKYIWMHNDLMQDSKRTINGEMPHFKNLSSLFTLYDAFDKIVSVSPKLTEINKVKMSEFADSSKFITVQNFIDFEEVLRESKEYRDFVPATPGRSFVSVGRLSPEKNQARMIRALKIVVSKFPDTQLYILGDGPLLSSLDALIATLGLKSNVHLLGYHRNPHSIVTKCDYFLFSSLYEGQGLAVIEAMVLGKPVVTTRYNVVESVVGPNDGIITENTDESLAAGMIAMLENGYPQPDFHPEKHNKAATKELRQLMNMDTSLGGNND